MLWKPFVWIIVLMPILFGLAMIQCGSGHGTCYLYLIFFPLMVLPDLIGADIHPFILAPVQPLVYGVALGIALKKGSFKLMAITLFVLHAMAVLFVFQKLM